MQENELPADLKDRMKNSYDAIANTYNAQFVREDDTIRLGYLDRLFQLLRSGGKEEASVLELGCGAGIPGTKILLENEQPNIRVTGNDLSSTQIELAGKNLSAFSHKLELKQGDMTQLSFPDGSFDAVVGFYSIIHLPRLEQVELVKKIAGWLKPDGFLLANFGKEEFETAVNQTWMGEEKGWVFWSSWGEKKSVQIVEEAGFEVLLKEVKQDIGDAEFVWIIGKKK